MLNELKDGAIGLALFISQWISIGGSAPAITLESVAYVNKQVVINSSISFTVKDQFTDLLDAGIPVRLRVSIISDVEDTITLLRTLTCKLSDYTYTIIDSSIGMKPSYVYVSKKYSQAIVALHDYAQFSMVVSSTATSIKIEATLLQSRASQLNRIVDMSQLFGFQKLSKSFEIRPRP
jgi:hypothetical protein